MRHCHATLLALLLTSYGPISQAAERVAELPAGFSIPVWHEEVRWEVEDPFAGCAAPGFLGGPRRESQGYARAVGPLYGPTQGGRNLLLSYDERLQMVHLVAGSARGFLDGPFSRARFGKKDYTSRPSWAHSPAGRFHYMTDVANGFALRRLDMQEQQVATIIRHVNDFGGLTIDRQGQLLMIRGEQLQWLDSTGKVLKQLKLSLQERPHGMGGSGASLALDEKHDRLYATAFRTESWYIWYWDLKDGSFHGVLPISPEATARSKDEPGPFAGTRLYGEGSVFFGPDDPDGRYLYTARVDTWSLFRLDLEKQEVQALTSERDAAGRTIARFVAAGRPTRVPVYGRAYFTADGSILSSRHTPFVATRCRRIQ